MLLGKLLAEILLEESVNGQDVSDAIDKHERVIINYHSKGKDEATGSRVIEVYAYGLTKSGNPVIRAFQPYGDTTSKVPSWKFFRLDRIDSWEPTGQTFSEPASDVYRGMGDFNPNGDKTMGVVYKVAQFDEGDVFKTDTERSIERTRQQMKNPININNLNKPKETSPKEPELKDEKPTDDVYKTPTERGMENLRKQLENPRKIDLGKTDDNEKEIENLRNKLGDTSEPINIGDLNNRLSQEPTEETDSDNLYKTDTERGLEQLRNNIANASKIDLDKIPKK